MAKLGLFWFLTYMFFGAYFINYALVVIVLPDLIGDFLVNIHKWITLVGGILIFIGGFNHYRAQKPVRNK